MWSHIQAPFFTNVTELCEYMKINRKFALVSLSEKALPEKRNTYSVHTAKSLTKFNFFMLVT